MKLSFLPLPFTFFLGLSRLRQSILQNAFSGGLLKQVQHYLSV